MELYLKEWRDQQHHESDSDQQQPQQQPLPLFSSEPTILPRMVSGGSSSSNGSSYLSIGQRQELEVQALIYKHVIAGASIPPQLQLLFNKTLPLNHHNNYSSPYNYLQNYYYQYPSLLQSGGGGGGYWGRGGMDPEPGRCRRTDGKKWRCSKDVVAGHKYCERHVHRGRNRSRKPVENTTSTTTLPPLPGGGGGGGAGAGVLKTNSANNAAIAAQSFGMAGGGGSTHFAPSFDLLHNNHRSADLIYDNKGVFRGTTQNELSNGSKSGDRILRHFFDDWPKSVEEHGNTDPATGLSISIPENPSSDFSLKLSTGDNITGEGEEANERERAQVNWGSTWGSNHVGSMGGGPLAEALRSSAITSNSSPTSVLHQLQRGSVSETSFISA